MPKFNKKYYYVFVLLVLIGLFYVAFFLPTSPFINQQNPIKTVNKLIVKRQFTQYPYSTGTYNVTINDLKAYLDYLNIDYLSYQQNNLGTNIENISSVNLVVNEGTEFTGSQITLGGRQNDLGGVFYQLVPSSGGKADLNINITVSSQPAGSADKPGIANYLFFRALYQAFSLNTYSYDELEDMFLQVEGHKLALFN